jgi:uncharacterized membrane protein (DUF373 family)
MFAGYLIVLQLFYDNKSIFFEPLNFFFSSVFNFIISVELYISKD